MLGRVLGAVGQVAGAVIGSSVGAVSGAVGLVSGASSGAASSVAGRTHVAVRGVHCRGAESAAARLERRLTAQDGIARAEVNAVLGRVMIAHDPDRVSLGDLARLVADTERELGLHREPYAPAGQLHPGAAGPVLREAIGVGLNVAGLAYATLARALPVFPQASLVLPLLGLVDATPRVRAVAENMIGRSAADVLLTVGGSVAQAVGRRPLGLVVDTCQRFTRFQEALARRTPWGAWDEELAAVPGAHRAPPLERSARPRPLPGGPVERVADASALFAVAGSAALLASLRAAPLATAALTAGVPKAAGAGREGFATQLDRDAAARGALVVDPEVLRRLDRVDTVVLDAGVLLSGRRVVEDVLPVTAEADPAEVVERVHDLVDVRFPRRPRERDGWAVGPLGPVLGTLTGPLQQEARQRAAHGATMLVLRRGETVVALVSVADELDPLAEAVVAAAAQAGSVLISRGTRRLERRLPVDGVAPSGLDPMGSVRALQRLGHVVVLVAADDGAALAAADVGIGLTRRRAAPPWGAHVLCRTGAQVCLLLEAVGPARQASRRSAQLSVAGSGLGALFAVLGPRVGAPARAVVAVQMAALLALGLGVSGSGSVSVGAREPGPPQWEGSPLAGRGPRGGDRRLTRHAPNRCRARAPGPGSGRGRDRESTRSRPRSPGRRP